MAKYKEGQKLWLNAPDALIQDYKEGLKGLVNYTYIISHIYSWGYVVRFLPDGNDGFVEPFEFVENKKNYLTKPTLAHILYG